MLAAMNLGSSLLDSVKSSSCFLFRPIETSINGSPDLLLCHGGGGRERKREGGRGGEEGMVRVIESSGERGGTHCWQKMNQFQSSVL